MSKLTNTPFSRASRRIGTSRSRTAATVASAAIGSNRAYSDDNLTDTLTGGIGPHGAESVCGFRRPSLGDLRQIAHQIEVLLLIRQRLGLARDRLAQKVQRERPVLAPQPLDRARRFFGVASRDQPLRHLPRPDAGRPRKQAVRRRERGQRPQRRLAAGRQMLSHIRAQQILVQMPRDGLPGFSARVARPRTGTIRP